MSVVFERYAIGDEYLDVCYKLWEASWEDDAVVKDRQRGIYADPAKVRDIAHDGEHYKVDGCHLSEPSPQRTPVLFQAGASEAGRDFAKAGILIKANPWAGDAHRQRQR